MIFCLWVIKSWRNTHKVSIIDHIFTATWTYCSHQHLIACSTCIWNLINGRWRGSKLHSTAFLLLLLLLILFYINVTIYGALISSWFDPTFPRNWFSICYLGRFIRGCRGCTFLIILQFNFWDWLWRTFIKVIRIFIQVSFTNLFQHWQGYHISVKLTLLYFKI